MRKGFVVWHIGSFPNPFRKDLRLTVYPWRQMRAVISYWQPSIVHLEDPNPIGWAMLRAAKTHDLPVVISHHFTLDYILSYLEFLKPVHPYVRKGLSAAVLNFYNTANHVICPSETLKSELLAAGLETPVTAVSNGIDLCRFKDSCPPNDFRSGLGLPDVPLVLYVGRIDPDKSLETLVEAMPLVLARHPVHFVFCGGGKMISHLARMIDRLALNQHVSFIGPFDYHSDDLPRIYKDAAMFVIPSQIETQSLVTLEAMASGLPVIAAQAGALPELIADGENGLLFRPGDSEDMASKIIELLDNPDRSRVMGQCGTAKAMEHDINNVLWRIEEIYYHVVESATPTTHSIFLG
jgi:glycosyltransferase involved in cell wall biosynthesis